MKNNFIVLVVGILLVAVLSGCTYGSGISRNSKEFNTSTTMSMKYDKFDGHKSTSVKVKEGEAIDINVDIVTVSGKISLSIIDENGKSFYKGTDIPTSTFVVSIDKKGKYNIKVSSENHEGSYKISWSKATQK
jgi:hypothetical protein